MTETDPKVVEFGRARSMRKVASFRYITPESTSTSFPKLQQAWQDMETGELTWETVPLVVVSDEEFRR